jgi:hypothetical protein
VHRHFNIQFHLYLFSVKELPSYFSVTVSLNAIIIALKIRSMDNGLAHFISVFFIYPIEKNGDLLQQPKTEILPGTVY